MSDRLTRLLEALDPTERAADPWSAWLRLREIHGPRVSLVDLYALVGARTGRAAAELSPEERADLWQRAAPLIMPGFQETGGSSRAAEPIVLVDHDPCWASTYDAWRDRLELALGPVVKRIEHIGSTAVSGLPAKPIVDIQVGLVDFDDEASTRAIEDLGLQLRMRDDAHRYFRAPAGRPRTVHLHVCRLGGAWEREHLLFRDYLRAHPSAAAEYAEAKRRAAASWPDDRMAYTMEKGELILAILEAAEAWARA